MVPGHGTDQRRQHRRLSAAADQHAEPAAGHLLQVAADQLDANEKQPETGEDGGKDIHMAGYQRWLSLRMAA